MIARIGRRIAALATRRVELPEVRQDPKERSAAMAIGEYADVIFFSRRIV